MVDIQADESSIYTVLHDIICVVGEEHSPIKPSLYRLILLPIDGFALAFQIIGCAVAFSDFTSDVSGPRFTDPKDAELFSQGLYIVTTGLVIQLVGLVAAAALMAVVTFRCILATREHGYTTFHRDLGYVPLPLSLRAMSLGLALATVLLLVRQFARIAELSQGDFSTDEDRFIGLESVMAVLALVLVAACHPGLLLQGIGRDARRGSAESYASSRGLVAEKRRRASSAAGRCVCAHGGQDHVHEQQRRMSSMRPSQQVMSGGLDGEEGRNSEDEANREDVEAFGHVARRPGVGGQLRSLWSLKRPRPSKAKGAWTSAGWLS